MLAAGVNSPQDKNNVEGTVSVPRKLAVYLGRLQEDTRSNRGELRQYMLVCDVSHTDTETQARSV